MRGTARGAVFPKKAGGRPVEKSQRPPNFTEKYHVVRKMWDYGWGDVLVTTGSGIVSSCSMMARSCARGP